MTDQRKRISSVIRKSDQIVEQAVRVLFILIFAFSGIGSVPLLNAHAQVLPLISVNGEMAAFNSAEGLTSMEQSYTVSAADLTADLVITAPQGFEISESSVGEYTSTLTLTPDEMGLVEATTIFVHFAPSSAADFSDVITHTSEGAEEVNQPVSGSSVPKISVTGTLDAFSAEAGSNSEAQSYQVSGLNLTGDMLISAPEHFALSLDPNGEFSDSLTLSPKDGVVAEATVYVIFESDEVGLFDGTISHKSEGAKDVGLEVSGKATIGMSALSRAAMLGDGITASASSPLSIEDIGDTYLRQGYATKGYGGSPTVSVSNGTSKQNSLYKWDLSSISTSATVTAASITFYVTDSSTADFSLFSLRRGWVEGTANDAVTTNSANYNTYDGTNSWGTAGAMNTTTDRTNTDLWDATSSTFSSSGLVTIPLNASGISIVQGWVTSPSTNFGLTMQFTGTTGTADYWIIASKDNTSGYTKPTLNVTFTDTSPTITTTGTLSAFNTPLGTPSAEQSYTVSGSNLTNDLVITAPADFQISTTSGSFSSNTLTLTPSSGTIATTTIYVRLNPSSATTYSGNITNVSTGATTVNVAVSGSSVPAITTTSTMSAFSTAVGSYSSEQSYTVSALNLTSDLTITPPAGFEISKTSGGAFVDSTGSLTYTPVNGVVSSQTIYVRFKNASAGTLTGNIAHTSGTASSSVVVSGTAIQYYTLTTGTPTGGTIAISPTGGSYASGTTVTVTATANSGYMFTGWTGELSGSTNPTTITMDGNKSISANFTAATCSTYSQEAADDTYMSGTNTTYNYGAVTVVKVSTSSSSSFHGTLMKWDVSSIPSGATITNASLSLYVSTSGGSQLFNLYNMRRSWVEGTATSSGSATGDGATWTLYDGTSGHTWGANGASSTTADRYDTTLWNATSSSLGSTGNKSIDLNANGIDVIQGWVKGTLDNYGLTIQNYSTSNSITDQIASAENTSYSGPTLNITYCVISSPTITLSASSLTGFASTPGTASTAQTVTVTGANLTSPISVTAPTGFIVSSDGSTYDSSATLPAAGGTLSVKMLSSSEGTPSGSITLSSTGAADKTIAVSGTVLYQYILTVGTDGNGTVTFSPSGGTYYHGQTVTLTPTANTGYKFSDWSGDNALDVVNTSGVYTIVMDGNKSLSANFAAKTAVTIATDVSPSAGGTVAVSPATGPYYEGDSVTFTATANSGYAFSNWTGSSTSTTNPLTVVLSGNVYLTAVFTVAEVCKTVNLEAVDDLYMSGVNTSNNYGVTTTLKTSYSTSNPRGDLFRWNVSSIPSNATISSASISLYVSSNSTATYSLYNMRRDWAEGTGDSSSTTKDGATWLTYDGTNTWTGEGASSTTADRFDTNLWSASSSSFSSPTGTKTVSLNTSGISVVQGWVDGSLSNYGLTMQNYGSSSSEYTVQFASAENTSNPGPTLNVTYCTGGSASHLLTVTNDGNGSVSLSPTATDNVYAEGAVVTLTTVPNTGYEFSNWTGTNADDVTGSGNTWTITMNTAKTIQANYTLLPVNVAPDAPVLTVPSNGATGTTLSPTLSATVSDGNTDDLTVKFYGRKAGTTAGSDFTFVLVPDPQNLVTAKSAALTSQFNWIVNNATANNIVFVSTTGDLVNTSTSTTEYATIDSMFDLIDTAGIPFSVGPGNHDYPLSNYNTYFGTSRFSGKSWYGGYYDSSNENNYSFFSASGNDFIVINLGYTPSSTILSWADNLLTTYSTKRAIVISHSMLATNNNWSYQDIYTALKGHSNLFLMLCGHNHSSIDGSAFRAETGTDGHSIYVMMADYQDYSQGYLRILRFSPADDMIYGTTYSPYTNGYLTSTSNYEATSLAYDLANGSAGAYSLIGTTTAASGTTASVSWSGLTGNTEYEWYATATDPDGETVSSASSYTFTTGSGTNTAPVLSAIGSKSGNELSAITFTASATDDGLPSGTLTYSLANGTSGTVPTGASINSSTGAFTWTPTEAQGPNTYTFDVCVSDGSLSDCETITVTVAEVNTAPTITDSDPQSMTVVENTATTLTLHANDADGNTITWSISTNGSHGSAVVSSTNTGTTQVITYTPALNSTTSDSFVVQASDGSLMDTITVNVTITPVDDAPVITQSSPQALSVTEDGSATLNLTATDVDTAAGSLTWSISTLASHGTASVSATPTGTSQVITYTPNTNSDSPDSFVVKLTDGHSNVYLTVNVTVTAVNDSPVFTESSPQTLTVAEDTSGTLSLNVTDVDTAASSLSWSISTLASHGKASVSATPTGLSQVITYSPDANYDSTDTFIVKVTDGSSSAYMTVNVTVTPVNDAPIITQGATTSVSMSVNGSPTAFSLTLNATDVDTLAATLTWSVKTTASHGTATAAGTGGSLAVSYVPTTDYVGSDSFEVQVSDGSGGTDTITVNVTITANTGNQTISLVPGWNLVSIKIVPSSTAIASVLSSISGNYDLVYAWDASSTSSDKWLIYDPSTGIGNTLTTLNNTQGFWVHMTAADDLVVTGPVPTTTTIPLVSGWNLISLPSNSEGTLPAILSSLGSNYSLVYGYDSSLSSPWLLYDRTGASYANKLTKLTPGWGYWIKVSTNTSLVITY